MTGTGNGLSNVLWQGLGVSVALATLFTLLLVVKSIRDFSQSGPQLRDELLQSYLGYTALAISRLALWALLLMAGMAGIGVTLYGCLLVLTGGIFSLIWASTSALLAVAMLTALQFSHQLLHIPASIAASSHYRMARLYALWHVLTPTRLTLARRTLFGAAGVLVAAAAYVLARQGAWQSFAALLLGSTATVAVITWACYDPEPRPTKVKTRQGRPNVLLMGCDTLRADRVGPGVYRRPLTPYIDRFVQTKATLFTHCYAPIARTAPNLATILTGTWPRTHGVRTNYNSDDEIALAVPSLPELLRGQGYRTVAVSDWCGSDLGKFSFCFDACDLPQDQWNIRYLIRQGPKDLRLFLSLFTHNRFGRVFLPEVYYLAGVPMGSHLGRQARRHLRRFAQSGEPFMLNVFTSHCHPPFGSEYPYYTLFADPHYKGDSKFMMSRLTDPFDIIRSQAEPKEAFDLDQIIDLYDGTVRSFDNEVSQVMGFLDRCGLADNTVVVIYSDHGIDLFEHNTWGQGNSVVGGYSNRTPLVVLDPRRPRPGIVSRPVRSADLAPTVLDLLGITTDAQMEGCSIEPYLNGSGTNLDLPVFCETGLWLTTPPGMHPEHITYPNLLELLEVPNKQKGTLAIKERYRLVIEQARDRMLQRGRWKLLYFPLRGGPSCELYDLETDPLCQHDRAAQRPDVLATMMAELFDLMGKELPRTSGPKLSNVSHSS